MFWRFVALLACLAAGTFAGLAAQSWLVGILSEWECAALGAAIGVGLWFFGDTLRASRLLVWLRTGDPRSEFARRGIWAEVASRVRRLLRERDRALRASDDRLTQFLSAIQASPNGVVLLDKDNRITWFNQTAAQHLGLDSARDLQQLIGNLVRDPSLAAYLQEGQFDHPVAIGGPEVRPGLHRSYSLHIHPYGEGQRLLLTRDITELELADAMRRDFVANVSHEIRTPLTVLAGFIETLQQLPLSETERSRYLALMDREAKRMEVLVGDLLTLSRLEGSPIPATDAWTPLAEIWKSCELDALALESTLSANQPAAHDLRFAGQEEAAGCLFAGERNELLAAMTNLVGNALRYTPGGGRVNVSWQLLPGGGGEFSVEDSGPGIAAEHLPRLTERFYRVDRGRSRETGGTGLGLAIVKHVVQRHGGTLHIDSTPGKGSRFAFKLPAARLRPPS